MTAPAGPIMGAQQTLKVSLSNSSTFQTWVGAVSAAAALNSIYHHGLPASDDGDTYTADEMDDIRPFAVIYTNADGWMSTAIAGGTAFTYRHSGSLLIDFEDTVLSANEFDDQEKHTVFLNTVGAVVNDLLTLSGTSPNLTIVSASLAWPSMENDPDQREAYGHCIGCTVRLDWQG